MAAVLIGSLVEENEDPISGLFVARSGISDSPMMLYSWGKYAFPKVSLANSLSSFHRRRRMVKVVFRAKARGGAVVKSVCLPLQLLPPTTGGGGATSWTNEPHLPIAIPTEGGGREGGADRNCPFHLSPFPRFQSTYIHGFPFRSIFAEIQKRKWWHFLWDPLLFLVPLFWNLVLSLPWDLRSNIPCAIAGQGFKKVHFLIPPLFFGGGGLCSDLFLHQDFSYPFCTFRGDIVALSPLFSSIFF